MVHKVRIGSVLVIKEICCAPIVQIVTEIEGNKLTTDDGFTFKKNGVETGVSKWYDPHVIHEIDCVDFDHGDSWEV